MELPKRRYPNMVEQAARKVEIKATLRFQKDKMIYNANIIPFHVMNVKTYSIFLATLHRRNTPNKNQNIS